MSLTEPIEQDHLPFLQGGGEMGDYIRSYDWSQSKLGAASLWPQVLKVFTATMLASPFPMHITWGSEFIQLYNDGYRPVLGTLKHPGALGNPIWESYPEIWNTVGPLFHQVMAGDAVRYTDFELVLQRNGYPETCYFDFSYSPIIDENGKIGGVLTSVIETTSRRLTELKNVTLSEEYSAINEELAASNEELAASNEELRVSNEELISAQRTLQDIYNQLEESDTALRLAIDAANFGTWHIHSVTRKFITSPRLRELFGFHDKEEITIEQAIGQVTEEYRQYVATTLENAIYHHGEYDVTYPVIGYSDNKLRWLRAMGKLRADHSGEFSDFTGVVMDISDIKKEEQRKNDFIGMVSHELKTPLTSVNAYLQVLQLQIKKRGESVLQRTIDRSLIQLKKMSMMINGFLNLSQLESGEIHLERTLFDLSILLKDVEEDFKDYISSHQLVFKPIQSVFINADQNKVGHVLNNLISNATKYSEFGTTVQISCILTATDAVISVRDEGRGIDSADQEKLFERYYRANDDNNISGFGIGLYLSSEIIKKHNGKIWLQSKPGEGSTFSFSLPLSPPQ